MSGAGDDDYIAFRAGHPGAWVINRHGQPGEMIHQIACWHFFEDLPSTLDSPKLVGTSRQALASAEPRFADIRRCTTCS